MQNLKIYLLIKDATTDDSLNMDGNFEIFKAFLDCLNKSTSEKSSETGNPHIDDSKQEGHYVAC